MQTGISKHFFPLRLREFIVRLEPVYAMMAFFSLFLPGVYLRGLKFLAPSPPSSARSWFSLLPRREEPLDSLSFRLQNNTVTAFLNDSLDSSLFLTHLIPCTMSPLASLTLVMRLSPPVTCGITFNETHTCTGIPTNINNIISHSQPRCS